MNEWCKGSRTPSTHDLIRIADQLGVSLDWLLRGKEESAPRDPDAFADLKRVPWRAFEAALAVVVRRVSWDLWDRPDARRLLEGLSVGWAGRSLCETVAIVAVRAALGHQQLVEAAHGAFDPAVRQAAAEINRRILVEGLKPDELLSVEVGDRWRWPAVAKHQELFPRKPRKPRKPTATTRQQGAGKRAS